ncbi:hypothetical protein [Streptomyces sp. NPDC050504]|uniref:hypothetical protein n=1 Tax=Streptomyces sp. NPDC050504 TaxID=3365618 RepID=UPI00378FE6FA
MLKGAMSHLGLSRLVKQREQYTRLPLPLALPATLGSDAVGVPARHGERLLDHLPRAGCVFADAGWWWWIVPAGSDLDLDWPPPVRYSSGAYVPPGSPRLVHPSDGATPYTPPIPLYLTVCQVLGAVPAWNADSADVLPTR